MFLNPLGQIRDLLPRLRADYPEIAPLDNLPILVSLPCKVNLEP
jgi:hypothetical protein